MNHPKAVILKSSWKEIFDAADPRERRRRWEEWKRIAMAAGEKGLLGV
jgi:hypothetical protein